MSEVDRLSKAVVDQIAFVLYHIATLQNFNFLINLFVLSIILICGHVNCEVFYNLVKKIFKNKDKYKVFLI